MNSESEVKTNLAELRDYNENLRLLATRLSLAEERERIEIAKEIHDGIGQKLVLCNIRLSKIILSSHSDELIRDLKEIKATIKETLNEAHALIFELSPPSLNHIGLEQTLKELTRLAGEKYHFRTSFEGDGQTNNMPEDVRILLFQMVRELLVNVSKHAQARNVKVVCLKRKKMIRITIADDGIGFDVQAINKKILKGIGIWGIQERISQIGGFLEIESKKENGTSITLVAPL